MEQLFAMGQEFFQLGGGDVVASDTQGGLDDTDGEGLATVSEVSHITAFRKEKFVFGVFAVGCDETVEMVLHLLEMRLAVPQGVVSVEGDYFDWQSGHIPLIIRLEDFCSKPLGSCTSGTSV